MIKGLLIFGALQGFVFSAALLSIKNPKSLISNRLFSFLILTVSIFLLVSSQGAYASQYPKFFLASYVLIYLYCPLYCLFSESLVTNDFKLRKYHLYYLLPAAVFAIVLMRYLFMTNDEMGEVMLRGAYTDLIFSDFISIMLNIYFVWKSWRIIQKSKTKDQPYMKTGAFLFLSVMLFLSNLVWLYGIVGNLGLPIDLPPLRTGAVYIVMSFMVFVFGYILIVKSEYFSIQKVIETVSYRNVNLDQATVLTFEQKIIETIETIKPYKKADFSLQELAELVNVDKLKLSYVISKSMNTNFNNLTNQYRVEEFIRLVNSNGFSNYSTLGIASEAGFKSKSTFYKAFKEVKGQTPKEFFSEVQV